MKALLNIILGLFLFTNANAGEFSCAPGTTPFVCTNQKGTSTTNRCATKGTCYDRTDNGQTEKCCPVLSFTDAAKKVFLELSKNPTSAKLEEFKKTCSFASPINFNNDPEISDAVKSNLSNGGIYFIKALIYAKSSCTDVDAQEMIFSWLGNETLLAHPKQLIRAIDDEKDKRKLFSIVNMEENEWRDMECEDQKCEDQRKAYFAKKREVLKSVKIEPSLEPVRQRLLKELKKDK